MLDLETRRLDKEILRFIRRYSEEDAPEEIFQSLAFQIFEYQFQRNKNYRKFCLLSGKKPGELKSWKEIPAIPAAGFKELVLATFPVGGAVRIFKTSGTAQNDRGVHFFDTLKLYEAAAIPAFRKYLMPATKAPAGLRPDSDDFLFFFLVASPKENPFSSLSYMMGVINERFGRGRGKFYVRKDRLQCEALLADLKKVGPKRKMFILSTAFSLKGFLDFLKSKKVSLHFGEGSRLMETGGFKGRAKEISKARLYGECEKRLGIKRGFCVSEYGMTELSSQFYDTTLRDEVLKIKKKPFKKGPAWLKTLVIDPQIGEEARRGSVGLLRHFDLANRGSVLAVQTEDLGRAVGEGFELIGRAPGADLRGCSLNYEEFLVGQEA